jgi:hypothetical protein
MVTVDVFLLHSLLIVSQITTYNRKPFNLKTNLLDRSKFSNVETQSRYVGSFLPSKQEINNACNEA